MYNEIAVKNIPLQNGLQTSGFLTQKKDNKNLVICCHGLGGNAHCHMNLSIRNYIVDNKLNYDCFRFNFYSQADNHRNFTDTTIESQVKDLESIIKHLKPNYDNIYLISASYGGLTSAILNSSDVTKQVLVDPSFIIDLPWAQATNIQVKDDFENSYFANFDKNVPMIFGESMKEEGLAFSPTKSQDYINKVTTQTLIIQAKSPYYELSKSLIFTENLRIKTSLIESGDHSFTKLGTMDLMLKEAFEFIK